jgi:hypothetical protein
VEPKCCETLRQLGEHFSLSARLYAEAVVNLTRLKRTAPEEYTRLREAAHQAQDRAEQARAAFEEHLLEHKCMAMGGSA